MKTWTRDELNKIAAEEEIAIAPLGRDGSPRKEVTIWIVRLGDDLFVRSAYGRGSAWFRSFRVRQGGRIRASGVEKEVTFLDADPKLNDHIDHAYRTKYVSTGRST